MISYDPVTKESRQIMNKTSAFAPWWGGFSQMPYGKILFSNKTGKGADIYSMNKDGGNETRLTSGAGINVNPVATADGKYIVFKSNRSGAANLWRMDADGSNPIQLTNYLQKELSNGLESYRSIQITNNSKTVFFVQQPKLIEKYKLMKISINGGEAVPLLPNSPTSNIAPRISPDGKKLAYTGFVFDRKNPRKNAAIYIHSLDGDRVGELEKKFDVRGRPQWTADGKALTYLNQDKPLWNIRKLDIETGKETALTSFESKSDQVSMYIWSNDGKKIFIVRVDWLQSDVVLIRNRDISKKLY